MFIDSFDPRLSRPRLARHGYRMHVAISDFEAAGLSEISIYETRGQITTFVPESLKQQGINRKLELTDCQSACLSLAIGMAIITLRGNRPLLILKGRDDTENMNTREVLINIWDFRHGRDMDTVLKLGQSEVVSIRTIEFSQGPMLEQTTIAAKKKCVDGELWWYVGLRSCTESLEKGSEPIPQRVMPQTQAE